MAELTSKGIADDFIRCWKCGTRNSKFRDRCIHCGEYLSR